MSNDGNFPSKIQSNSLQSLHDNGLRAGSLIDAAVRSLDEEQTKNLLAKAAEEALRLETKSREQNMDYIAGKKVAEDHIDTFSMLEKSGRLTRQSVTSDIKTGAGNMRIESKSGATCFVASVAYDDPNHPDVMFLRWYRDHILQYHLLGRVFIATYWKVGPKIAKFVGRTNMLRSWSRYVISIIVKALKNKCNNHS